MIFRSSGPRDRGCSSSRPLADTNRSARWYAGGYWRAQDITSTHPVLEELMGAVALSRGTSRGNFVSEEVVWRSVQGCNGVVRFVIGKSGRR